MNSTARGHQRGKSRFNHRPEGVGAVAARVGGSGAWAAACGGVACEMMEEAGHAFRKLPAWAHPNPHSPDPPSPGICSASGCTPIPTQKRIRRHLSPGTNQRPVITDLFWSTCPHRFAPTGRAGSGHRDGEIRGCWETRRKPWLLFPPQTQRRASGLRAEKGAGGRRLPVLRTQGQTKHGGSGGSGLFSRRPPSGPERRDPHRTRANHPRR